VLKETSDIFEKKHIAITQNTQ